jgi:hypothetical protein
MIKNSALIMVIVMSAVGQARAADPNYTAADPEVVMGTITWKQVDGGTAGTKAPTLPPIGGAGANFYATAKFGYKKPDGSNASPTDGGSGSVDVTYKRKYTYVGSGNAPSFGPWVNVTLSGSLSALGPMPAGSSITISGGSPLWTSTKGAQFPGSLATPSLNTLNDSKTVSANPDSTALTNRTFTASVSVKVSAGAGAPSGMGYGASSKADVTVVFKEL